MPVFDDQLARVSIRWTPVATPWVGEEAIHTFWLHHHHTTGGVFNSWPDELTHAANAIRDKLVTHWALVSDMFTSSAGIREIKAVHINTNGSTYAVGQADMSSTTLNGASGTSMLPPEVAACLSSWAYEPGTFVTNKGRKRGRQYLPYLAARCLGSLGTYSSAHLTDDLNGWQTIFNDIQGMHTLTDQAEEFWDFAVVSSIDGTWDNVSWLSMDSHFDSQRRRQHQAPSTRAVVTISHSD